MRDKRRITLVSRNTYSAPRSWNASADATNRIIFVGAFNVLRYALDHVSHDVERILIDGTATPGEFLELLATLPSAFIGDVMLIRSDNSSFLSTACRADGRLLYSLTPTDLQFYLETQGLATRAAA
jgi:hypothetical protein